MKPNLLLWKRQRERLIRIAGGDPFQLALRRHSGAKALKKPSLGVREFDVLRVGRFRILNQGCFVHCYSLERTGFSFGSFRKKYGLLEREKSFFSLEIDL
jgi:hypothetical protein